ncbi:hypothetical protein C8F01DRAFT_1136975 [Mycena amicta]|nr:hypothetical protein C8F01DRAFT_1136975 [Mycena amicta]
MLQGLLESLPAIYDISRFPPETLEEIIAFVPPESHLALCLVSKLISALTIRHIYADVVLHSPAAVVKCCNTIVNGNPLVALAVRTFEISYAATALRPFKRFYTLIGRTLVRITNVHKLALLVPDPHYAADAVLTPNVTLPRLVHFNSLLSLSDTSVVAFLNRHRRISYLQLNAHSTSGSPPIPHTTHITLPRLEYFSGNSMCVAPVIQGGASLRAAFITWDDGPAPAPEPEIALAALERSCTDTLNFLGCRRQGWNIDLLERISTHLPHIYALSLTNLFSSSDAAIVQPPANLDAIGTCLSRFSCLERLVISCVNVWYPWEEGVLQMDEAFDTVTSWGAVCPSLVECTLPQSNHVQWIRVCDNLWLPQLADNGMCWLWGRLRADSYRGWDKVVGSVCGRKPKRALVDLRTAALAREYADTDAAAVAVRDVRLGGVGWFVDDDEDEEEDEDLDRGLGE